MKKIGESRIAATGLLFATALGLTACSSYTGSALPELTHTTVPNNNANSDTHREFILDKNTTGIFNLRTDGTASISLNNKKIQTEMTVPDVTCHPDGSVSGTLQAHDPSNASDGLRQFVVSPQISTANPFCFEGKVAYGADPAQIMGALVIQIPGIFGKS